MKKLIALFCTVLLIQTQVFATILPEGKAIIIQPQQEINADNIKQGETVNFTVVQPVKNNGITIIKAGTEVKALVAKKKNNFILGIPGEIVLNTFQIITTNSDIINLQGSISDKGEGRYWAHIGWFFAFPLLFIKGNDGKIPANTNYTLYTLEDINF